MARATVGAIELEYETAGSPDNPTILLVMGLGAVSYTHLTLPTICSV